MENIGGMQRVALKLHETLSARADRDSSFTYDSLLLRSTWRWVHLRTPFFLTRTAASIVRMVRRDEVDVLLFSSMVTASLAVPLQGILRRNGVHTAAIVHGLDVTTPFPPYQWLVPKIFGALDGVFPVSRATARASLHRGADPEKLHVVPNGIDADRFAPPKNGSADRKALSTALDLPAPAPSPDSLLLCSVGRQVKRKGTAWFINSVMPELPSDVHYWIAGDGPEDDAIQSAIDNNDLAPRVRRLGRISNESLAHLYRGSDLFVMPNVPVEDDMEGFGIVLLEAGQCGTPAIASRLEGIQDVVTNGVNGHLVEPESPTGFKEAILRYRNAPQALSDAAQRAVDHTHTTFGWETISEHYLSALRSLLDSGAPPNSMVAAPLRIPVASTS